MAVGLSQERLGSVAVDMSGILAVGDAYEVRNVRDFFGTPAVTGTYGGGSITIPITARTPSASAVYPRPRYSAAVQ